MTIGVDARLVLHDPHGMSRYIFHVLWCLSKLDTRNRYILYTDLPDHDNVFPKNFEVRVLSSQNIFMWEQLLLPQAAKKDNVDILHCTANTAPVNLDKRIALITTIHDVIYLHKGDSVSEPGSFYQRLGRMYRRMIVPRSTPRADRIMTVSNFSKQEICSYLHVDPSFVDVIYVGCEFFHTSEPALLELIKSSNGIHGDYIMASGGVSPRKNTHKVIEVFAALHDTFNGMLVFTGIPQQVQETFMNYARKIGIEHKVRLLGFLPESQVHTLLNQARLFLYLSRYEGFGLPVVEAMRSGVAVVASNTSSIPEIAGDSVNLVNPNDTNEIVQTITRLLSNSSLREEYIRKGKERSQMFQWNTTARRVLEVYESVYKQFGRG